jgi:hypothetical protein
MAKLIPLWYISQVLGKPRNYMLYRSQRNGYIGEVVINNWRYYNLPYAKCMATKYSIFSDKPLTQILEEIENYEP